MLVGIISRSDFDLSIMLQAVISSRGWPLPLGIGRSGHSLPLIRRPGQPGGVQHQQHQQEPSSRQYKATPDAAIRPLIVSQHALKCHTADSVETHSSSVPLIAVLVPTCLIVPSKSVASHTNPTPLSTTTTTCSMSRWRLLLARLLLQRPSLISNMTRNHIWHLNCTSYVILSEIQIVL